MAVKKTSKAPRPKGSPAKKTVKKKAAKNPIAPKSKSPAIKRGGSTQDAFGMVIRIINGVKTPVSEKKKK